MSFKNINTHQSAIVSLQVYMYAWENWNINETGAADSEERIMRYALERHKINTSNHSIAYGEAWVAINKLSFLCNHLIRNTTKLRQWVQQLERMCLL